MTVPRLNPPAPALADRRPGTSPLSKGRIRARRGSGDWQRWLGTRSLLRKLWGSFWRKRQKERRSRPISRVLSRTVIPLGAASPLRSSNLPGDTAGRGIVSLFGLAPGGVCRAGLLPDSRCALTAPFHPYHARLSTPFGGLLSVALSVGSRRPGVTWHRALWSPDFPRHSSRRTNDATAWPTPPRAFYCFAAELPPKFAAQTSGPAPHLQNPAAAAAPPLLKGATTCGTWTMPDGAERPVQATRRRTAPCEARR